MTKTDAAVQTLADINPDVVLEVRFGDYFTLAICNIYIYIYCA